MKQSKKVSHATAFICRNVAQRDMKMEHLAFFVETWTILQNFITASRTVHRCSTRPSHEILLQNVTLHDKAHGWVIRLKHFCGCLIIKYSRRLLHHHWKGRKILFSTHDRDQNRHNGDLVEHTWLPFLETAFLFNTKKKIAMSRPTVMFAWPRWIASLGAGSLIDVCGMSLMKGEIVYLLADNGVSLNRNLWQLCCIQVNVSLTFWWVPNVHVHSYALIRNTLYFIICIWWEQNRHTVDILQYKDPSSFRFPTDCVSSPLRRFRQVTKA